MGIRYRGRTKGKNGWLNFSYSKKNGLNWSASAKAGPFTWNSGNGATTKRRITTNLPGGFYHVTSTTRNRRKTSSPLQWSGEDVVLISKLILAGTLIVGSLLAFGVYGAIGAAILVLIYVVVSNMR